MTHVVRLACFLAIAVGFARADEPERIVSGSAAAPGEFPHAVSLELGRIYICGGAIISEYHVLTAAHCVESIKRMPYRFINVVTGTTNLEYGGQSHAVETMTVHPQYNLSESMWQNDIAVIKLKTPITFDKLRKPISLPTEETPANVTVVVSGWGSTAPPPLSMHSDTLQKLVVKTLTRSECQSHYSSKITDDMQCIFIRKGAGVCSGDSGSAVTHNHQLIGIVSGGKACALGAPDVLVKVYKMLPFIQEAMKA